MAAGPAYVPLYPPYGGAPRAYACELENDDGSRCSHLSLTEQGARGHARGYHGVKFQGELYREEDLK